MSASEVARSSLFNAYADAYAACQRREAMLSSLPRDLPRTCQRLPGLIPAPSPVFDDSKFRFILNDGTVAISAAKLAASAPGYFREWKGHALSWDRMTKQTIDKFVAYCDGSEIAIADSTEGYRLYHLAAEFGIEDLMSATAPFKLKDDLDRASTKYLTRPDELREKLSRCSWESLQETYDQAMRGVTASRKLYDQCSMEQKPSS
jgi:hypothetical protein